MLSQRFKIRCSQISKIMSKPRDKTALIGETTKTYLEEWIKEKKYGRRKQITTSAMKKGNECEDEATFILSQFLWYTFKQTRYQWDERMENEFWTWREDIDSLWYELFDWCDTKVCESFDTFPLFDIDFGKDYRRQAQGYMRLKWEEYKKRWVAKILCNSPAWMIEDKLKSLYYSLLKQYNEWETFERIYKEQARELFKQHVFDKEISIPANWEILQLTDDLVIPYSERVKIQIIERDDKAIKEIEEQVMLCRHWLKLQGF